MKKILVTGGCGYIGSHTVVDLLEHGYEVISLDNNYNADFEALRGIKVITGHSVKNYTVDLCHSDGLRRVFAEQGDIAGIIHFAALKSVNESTQKPLLYFQNNMIGLLNLLQCAQDFGVQHFIFSSSCSVYGNAKSLPVTEDTPFMEAECPYARTKQMGEKILADMARFSTHFNTILLRYFNPAGAHPSNAIGERSLTPASNLVPVITETAIGKRAMMTVFGTDYATADGSCVRDYIHVADVAHAHTRALQYAESRAHEQHICEIFNLGIGKGVSVLEAIRAFENVSATPLRYQLGARREGDVEAIYADNSKAREKLRWQPRYTIDDIMATAWAWEQKRTAMEQTATR